MTRPTLLLLGTVALYACSSSPLPDADQAVTERPLSERSASELQPPPSESPAATENAAPPDAAGEAFLAGLLKARIRTIAAANTGQKDNLKLVELQLRPLVAALSLLNPYRTPEQTRTKLEGPWRCLWYNLDMGPFPVDGTQAHQVFTTRGYYYNLFNVTLAGRTVIYALRAAYAPIPEGFSIRFTQAGYMAGTLAGTDGIGMADLAEAIEDGRRPLSSVGGTTADWPAGATGKLTTMYLDDDLRIAGGELAPTFDNTGTLVLPGQENLLFILER